MPGHRPSARFRRGIVRAIAVAAGAGIVATGCSSATTPSGSTSGSSAAPLKIGISLSLTGDFADPGKAAKRGYELWADDVNARGGVLGRKVTLTIVDDTSSPNQVVTNYQNLINRDRVDLVFGPFSSLLTIPASRVASRFGYAFIEPAGGGPSVFAQKLTNLFFVQPAPVVAQGGVFADYILSLPADQRPKTAAYPKLDDPFAAPVADYVRTKFEAAGIRTVYQQTYPAEATDLTSVMSRVAAAKPDVIVSGTQSADAYAQVKALVQLKFSPKWMFMSNGANSPVEFPDKVGKGNVNGIFSSGDWFPGSKASGSATFTAAYLNKYGGTANDIDSTSVDAYSCGVLVEEVAKKAGKVDNKTLISTLHSGTWPTPSGDLSWDAYGSPQGKDLLVQWVDNTLQAVYPSSLAQHAPLTVKPNWGG